MFFASRDSNKELRLAQIGSHLQATYNNVKMLVYRSSQSLMTRPSVLVDLSRQGWIKLLLGPLDSFYMGPRE